MQDDEGLFGGAVLSCELHDEHQKQHSVDEEHRRRRRRRARRRRRGRARRRRRGRARRRRRGRFSAA